MAYRKVFVADTECIMTVAELYENRHQSTKIVQRVDRQIDCIEQLLAMHLEHRVRCHLIDGLETTRESPQRLQVLVLQKHPSSSRKKSHKQIFFKEQKSFFGDLHDHHVCAVDTQAGLDHELPRVSYELDVVRAQRLVLVVSG